jgi:hypothetical protein
MATFQTPPAGLCQEFRQFIVNGRGKLGLAKCQHVRPLAPYAAIPSTGGSGARPRMMSDAFSAIIMVEL